MRSSEVRNLKFFEMTKKNRILELLVTNFAQTHSELPKQPIVHWLHLFDFPPSLISPFLTVNNSMTITVKFLILRLMPA